MSSYQLILLRLALVPGLLLACDFARGQAIGPPPGDLEAKDGEPPLAPTMRWGEKSVEALEAVKDYTARLIKRERIRGRLEGSKLMFLKIRHMPLSVYARFETTTGRVTQEIIYVEGRNRERMWVHSEKRKILGTVSVYPRSRIALREGRYPITEIGLLQLTKQLVDHVRRGNDLDHVKVKSYPNATIDGRPTLALAVTNPAPDKKLTFHHARVFIDREWNVPVRYEAYDFPRKPGESPRLTEQYTYSNLQFNVGLTDVDFDIRNPEYEFPIHETDERILPTEQDQPLAEAPREPDEQPKPEVPAEPVEPTHPPTRAQAFVEASRKAIERLSESPSYMCLIVRQQEVDGRLDRGEYYRLKVRRQPSAMYARGLWPTSIQHQRFLHVANIGQGRVVSRISKVGPVERLSPGILQKRLNDQRPLTELRMQTLLADAMAAANQREGTNAISVRRYSKARIDSRDCVCYEIDHLDTKHRDIGRRRIFFDKRTELPLRFEWYAPPAVQGASPRMLEAVTFREFDLGAKLTPRDFDVTNPLYGFSWEPVAAVER